MDKCMYSLATFHLKGNYKCNIHGHADFILTSQDLPLTTEQYTLLCIHIQYGGILNRHSFKENSLFLAL